MTTHLSLFDNPMFLGFDDFEKTVNRIRKAGAEGYPPYNIEQIGEEGLCITLAVAGFSMDCLDVEIEQNQLTIRGKQEDENDRIYIHRGIAARQFQRSFVLADGIEVRGANLSNGLLHIDLERIAPESNAIKIKIHSPTEKNNSKSLNAIDIDSTEKK